MNDKYNNFHNRPFDYDYPIDFKCHPLDYMIGDLLATYEMNYKDTARLAFQIDPEYLDCDIQIRVYNFRYEELLAVDTEPDYTGKVYLDITADIAKNTLKKGVYYCEIKAITYEPIVGTEPIIRTCTTIMPPEKCSILIK